GLLKESMEVRKDQDFCEMETHTKEQLLARTLFNKVLFRWAKHLHDACKLFLLIFSRKDRITSVEFSQNTAQAPHVNWQTISHAQNNFWRPIEARLDIGVDLFILKARRTKVNDLDISLHWVGQKDILRFEIAMNNLVALQQTQTAQH